MIQKKIFSIFLFTILTFHVNCQIKNQRDAAGLRQGYWEAVDSRGMLVYAGYFKDDNPVGEMKRYFPDGGLRVIMYHDSIGSNVRARFFWPNTGVLASQGNYIDTKRDSVWLFYGQNRSLLSRIEYHDGKRNGIEQKFFSENGGIAEEITWKDDQKEGPWKQYFVNGQLKFSAYCVDDKLEGAYTSFYPDGKKENEGFFRNGLPDGEWIRYNDNGEYVATIKYENGFISNLDELEKSDMLFLIDEVEEYIPEPTIEDFFR